MHEQSGGPGPHHPLRSFGRGFTRASLVAAIVALAIVAVGRAAQPPAVRPVFAVGDIHGELDGFISVLQRAGLIDAAGTWAGGTAMFVQTGDYTDCGANVRGVMDLLMALEGQANGQVIVLLGNHEAMQVLGDRRDVTPDIYATFADSGSERRREDAWKTFERLAGRRRRELSDANIVVPPVYAPRTREEWMAVHPPGSMEYVDAMGPKGQYGRWIRQRQTVVRVDDSIFVHGGLDPSMSGSLEDISRRVRDEMLNFDRMQQQLVLDGFALPFFTLEETVQAAGAAVLLSAAASAQRGPGDPLRDVGRPPYHSLLDVSGWNLVKAEGPLWFRGYGMWTDAEGRDRLKRVLTKHGAARIVVGHTVYSFRVTARFENRAFLIDTGMLAAFNGRASALEIRGSQVTAVYDDGRVSMTATASGF